MIKHGWLINKDFTNNFDSKQGDDVTVIGPKGCPFSATEIKEKGTHFKLYDGDNVLYYSGYVIESPDDGETILAPLDNYGMPNAGAVAMKIRKPDGSYEDV